MIKKAFFACLMTLMALMAAPAQAQTMEELMPMVAQEMNKELNATTPITKAQWDAKSSSLILFMNQNIVAESGISEADFKKADTKKFIKDNLFSGDSEMAEVIQAMEQLGVRLVIRIPLGKSYTDIPISSSDFK